MQTPTFERLRVNLSVWIAIGAGILSAVIAYVLIPDGGFAPLFKMPLYVLNEIIGSLRYQLICRLPPSISSLIPVRLSAGIGNLNDVFQLVTVVVCGLTCWWMYRLYSYHRDDTSAAEKQAEPIFSAINQTWKDNPPVPTAWPANSWAKRVYVALSWLDRHIKWRWIAIISNIVIRLVITWVTIFLINTVWALVGINLGVSSKAVQWGLVVVYGLFIGYAVTYLLVGLDDWDFVIVYGLFGISGYALLWAASTCRFNLHSLRIAEGTLINFVTQAQADLFKLTLVGGKSIPPSVSFFGTNLSTSAMFTILILIFGLFNLILTRDTVNDWWWLRTRERREEAQGAQFNSRAASFIVLLRIATSLTIFTSALVAIFPATDTSLPWVSPLHHVGGIGLVLTLIALMIGTPWLLSPSPQHPDATPTAITISAATLRWFRPFSWLLLGIGIVAVGLLLLVQPFRPLDGSSFKPVLAVEVIAFPITVIWMTGLNLLTKKRLAEINIMSVKPSVVPPESREEQEAAK